MDETSASIISQNAGNSAAVLTAAALQAGHVEQGKVIETFDRLRAHITAGTITSINQILADTNGQTRQANPLVQIPPHAPPVNPPQPIQPQATVQTAAPPPTCNHGPRVYKTGTSSKGPWSAWMCSQRKDAPDRCSPVFL